MQAWKANAGSRHAIAGRKAKAGKGQMGMIGNEKGQAFAVYRLLIGGIIAIMILFIIMGTWNYLEGQRVVISESNLRAGLQNAVSSPNGKTLVVEKLTFRKGTVYTAGSFSSISGLPASCISLEGSSDSMKAGSDAITITSLIITDVFITCSLEDCDSESDRLDDVFCEISFGKDPRD